MSDTSKLTLLGNTVAYPFDNPSAKILEVFDNQTPDARQVVGLVSDEFTSLCPMTGQPDFATIHIAYIPNKLCVESKSLKLYLFSYRNHGAFHEDCINQIAEDLCNVMQPRYIRVYGDFHVRGGIAIKPMSIKAAEGTSDSQHEEYHKLMAEYDSVNRI